MYLALPTRIAPPVGAFPSIPPSVSMARSLTIKHEETATTSPLMTGFLAFAMVWLLVTAVAGYASDIGEAPQSDVPSVIIAE